MFALFRLIFTIIGSIFAIVFGVVNILFSLVFGIVEFSLLVPAVLFLAIFGLFFWQPLLWIGLVIMIYYIIRMNRKERYIKLRRN